MQVKKILYVSCVCSKKVEHKLFEMNPALVGQQIQKYHRLLLQGFAQNGAVVQALSNHQGLEQIAIKTDCEENVNYTYETTKWKKITHLPIFLKSFWNTCKWFKNNPDGILFCDVLSVANAMGAVCAAKLRKKKIVGIITDFPEQLPSGGNLFVKLVWKVISLCTGYIVMTSFMGEKLNPQKKIMVLEGHVDINCASEEIIYKDVNESNKICVYAGTLHEKYGIKKMVQAFVRAKVPNAELHLFGDGDCAEWIKKIADSNVKYHGIKENATVLEFEKRATVLINPRPTDEEFAKFSFPSKNMEYMVSGTPLITTILPGMPKEYLNYIYVFEDETIEGMTRTINEVLSKNPTELSEMGKSAQKFVLEEKNNYVQAKKIIDTFFS